MDASALAILGFGGAAGATAGKLFLEKTLGPVFEGAAAPLAAWKNRRVKHAEEIIDAAAAHVAASGVEPVPVPGRILWPILERGSIEEDDELRRKFAALLANSAHPKTSQGMLPGFTDILSQLTPTQAKILDWMFDNEHPRIWPDVGNWKDAARGEIEERFALAPAEYALLISDLERLQLIEPRRDLEAGKDGVEYPVDVTLHLVIARWNSRIKYDSIGLTALGVQFVRATRPPRP